MFDTHTRLLRLALDEARKCEPTPTAFCVGCVLALPRDHPTDSNDRESDSGSQPETPLVLSTGFSRELAGNTHAEANALAKARALSPDELSALVGKWKWRPSVNNDDSDRLRLTIDDMLRSADVYTTMEPCSVRTSGLAPCARALIEAGVRRCFIGVGEPADFVNCEGAMQLKEAGIEVIWVEGLEKECLEVARRGHQT
ncbi:hypothetical protein BOTBODRAFT_115867 [Botryobasidium botryosum FD-172 SS1]|uniref:CMP/dCMP-type deaminase domain-containing protein n=1 Tax=Botryobasidium botryosum (strain FD-172 SS1) TaxID=930990 RepID=A0A067MET2_BOTB1|nr:hypothetical protein BOTBODRAFT_115867 [Botryobasidium botryosum FD-172 SS1]